MSQVTPIHSYFREMHHNRYVTDHFNLFITNDDFSFIIVQIKQFQVI